MSDIYDAIEQEEMMLSEFDEEVAAELTAKTEIIAELNAENVRLVKEGDRIKKSCSFHIKKLLKHNEISSHDREMMRQLLEKMQ